MTIEQKIELLREEWRANPEHRDRIELQAKVLKLGILAPVKLIAKTKQDSFEDIVKSSLL